MTTNDEQYVPSDEGMENCYVLWSLNVMDVPLGDREAWAEKLRAEFLRGLARVRRDAAREALDGLYEDASQDYSIGLQDNDRQRMEAAEAVMRATCTWIDNYPETGD